MKKGTTMSEESKEKMRASALARGILPPLRKGTNMPEESKKKISLNNARFWNNKSFSDEHKSKLSKSHLGKSAWNKDKVGVQEGRKGKKSNFWKDGVFFENYTNRQIVMSTNEYKIWRKSIFERDNYTCVLCNQRGGKLHADHIKPFAQFPELILVIDNGRTLCEECHKKTDTYGGKSRINISRMKIMNGM